MTAAPRWSRAGVPGELADVIRRLLRGLLAACRLASDGVAGTGGRQTAAMGFQAGQYRELRALGAAGRLDPCPGVAPGSARTRTHSPSPGSQVAPSRCLAGTPALPRARPGPAAAAGSRIVHLLRRLRRPRPGPGDARLPGAVLGAAPRACTVTGKPFTMAGSAVP